MSSASQARGERLMLLREERGETQSDVASLLGFNSHQQVSYIERGDREIKLEHLIVLSNHYGVTTDYLLCKTDIKSPDANVQGVCAYTGLNEITINKLHKITQGENIKTEVEAVYSIPAELKTDKENLSFIDVKGLESKIKELSELERKRRIEWINKVLSSPEFDNTVSFVSEFSTFNKTICLTLALFFRDYNYIENNKELFFESVETTPEDVMSKLMKYLANSNMICSVSAIKDEYYLSQYKVSSAMSDYLKKQFTGIETLSKNIRAEVFDFLMSVVYTAIYKALEAERPVEEFNNIINRELNTIGDTLKEKLAYIYEEMKENG